MKLHENTKLFKESIRFTAQQRGIKDIYIEKDYWVTLALFTVFSGEAKEFTVFKGGTALSKCYGIIERFSEDIDMVVLNEGESGNQLKERLRTLSKSIESILPEIEVVGVTSKRGMIRKTAHSYAKHFEGNYGQVRDFLVLESTWLGYHEPYSQRSISTYIYQMTVETGQEKIAEEYDLEPFKVRVLDPIRTICEKIMSLVRFSHSDTPLNDLNLKVRHLYDLHQLLTLKDLSMFLNSVAFEQMLLKVAQDDVVGYRSNNEWLVHAPKEALLFSEPDETWRAIEKTYTDQFADLVFGSLPPADSVLQTIKRISERLQTIVWDINPKKPS